MRWWKWTKTYIRNLTGLFRFLLSKEMVREEKCKNTHPTVKPQKANHCAGPGAPHTLQHCSVHIHCKLPTFWSQRRPRRQMKKRKANSQLRKALSVTGGAQWQRSSDTSVVYSSGAVRPSHETLRCHNTYFFAEQGARSVHIESYTNYCFSTTEFTQNISGTTMKSH